MNRLTAIFFILIANIVMLANAVMPHHHHEEDVCFVKSHCQSEDDKHNHGTSQHNHEHDCNSDFQNCVLKQEVVLPSNDLKQECKYFSYIDQHSDFEGFQAVLTDSEFIKSFLPNQLRAHTPLIHSFYSQFVISSLGLRAPPIV